MRLRVVLVAISIVLASGTVFAVAPVITLAQPTLTFNDVESDTYRLVAVGATATDTDGGVNGDGELTVCADGGARGGSNGVALDELYINTDGTGLTIELNLANIKENLLLYNGSEIAILGAGNGLAPLVVAFTRSATMAEVTHIIQNIMWRNRANSPRASRVFAFRLFDGFETSEFANLTINVTHANKPPVNRTNIVMKELNPALIRDEYFGGEDWHLDRGPSKSFAPEVFDGDSRFKLVIDDNPQVGSHQGYMYPAENATHVSVDLYVPSDWGVTGGAAPSLWINSFSNDGERIEDTYPIIRVQQKASESHPAYFQCYINDAWDTQALPADVKLDTWMNLDVRLEAGDVLFKLTGEKTDGSTFELTAKQTGTTADTLWQAALEPATAAVGEEYTVYYDNFTFNSGSTANETWESLEIGAGSNTAIVGLEVADPNNGDILTTTLTTSAGTFSVTSQLGASVAGNQSSTIKITGSPEQINATLKTLFFKSSLSVTGIQTITVHTEDMAGLSSTDTIELSVAPRSQQSIEAVPCLTEWGMILFSLLLMAGALVITRHGKRSI